MRARARDRAGWLDRGEIAGCGIGAIRMSGLRHNNYSHVECAWVVNGMVV